MLSTESLVMHMKKEDIKTMIENLLRDIEEEDVGISLLSTLYQDANELAFFKEPDREKVTGTLKKMAEDSVRHKKILETVINELEKKAK